MKMKKIQFFTFSILIILFPNLIKSLRMKAFLQREGDKDKEWIMLMKFSKAQEGFKIDPDNWQKSNLWTDKSNQRYIQFWLNSDHVRKIKIHKIQFDGALRGGFKWKFNGTEIKRKEITDPKTKKVRYETEKVKYTYSKSQSRTFYLERHFPHTFYIDLLCDPKNKNEEDFELDQSFGRIMILIDSVNLVTHERERWIVGFDSLCSKNGIRSQDKSQIILYILMLLVLFFSSKVNLNNPLNMIGRDGTTDRIDAFNISMFFGAGVVTILLSLLCWDFLLPILKFTFSFTCFSSINITLKKMMKWMFVGTSEAPRYRPAGNVRGPNPNRPVNIQRHFLIKNHPYLFNQKPIHAITILIGLLLIYEYFDTRDWLVPNIFLLTILYTIQYLYLPLSRTQYVLITIGLYAINIFYSRRSMRVYNRQTLIESPLKINFQIPKYVENWKGQFALLGILNVAIAGLGIKGLRKRRLNKFNGFEGFIGVGAIATGLLFALWTDKTEWTGGTAECLAMMTGACIIVTVECVDKMLSGRSDRTAYGGSGSSSHGSSRTSSESNSFNRALERTPPSFEISDLNANQHGGNEDYNNYELGYDRYEDSGGLNISVDEDRLWV